MTTGQKVLVTIAILGVAAAVAETLQGGQAFIVTGMDVAVFAFWVVLFVLLYRWLGRRGSK